MKKILKGLKEGMVIWCENEDELRQFCSYDNVKTGYPADVFLKYSYPIPNCFLILEGFNDKSVFNAKADTLEYYITEGYRLTKFSDLVHDKTIPSKKEEDTLTLTAEEVVYWLGSHYLDGTFKEVFGQDFLLPQLIKVYSPHEIVKRIAEHKEDHTFNNNGGTNTADAPLKKKTENKNSELEQCYAIRIVKRINGMQEEIVHEEPIPEDIFEQFDTVDLVENALISYCESHSGEYEAYMHSFLRVNG